MAKKARSIDGFVPRPSNRPRPTLNDVEANVKSIEEFDKPDKKYHDIVSSKKSTKRRDITAESSNVDADIMESLADLPGYNDLAGDDFANSGKVNKKALKKSKKSKAGKKKGKKPLKITLTILAVIGVLVLAGFLALKYLWPNETIDGDFWGLWQNERLQADENGRSNILIFGTEPEGYDGQDLTDSIMVLSINQDDGSAYTVSLPRDMYVQHTCPNFGTSAGKLNETYACIIDDNYTNEDAAAAALQDKAGEILGLDVQYYVHLNWAGFEQIINAVGGVDVVIESSDPRGIYDVSTGIKFANGTVHLDGATALALARARGSAGGYGLESSNFAREIHQQKIVKALAEKVISGDAITNPSQALDLLNSLGDNLHTNFKTNEIRSLANLADVFSDGNMVGLPLLDSENDINLVTTDMINGASVVVPTAGTYNYSEIHAYIKQNMSSDPVTREAAVVSVLNGTVQPGLAQTEADKLSDKGYTIGTVSNAPDGSYAAVEVYQIDSTKTGTAKALSKLYGVEVKTTVPAGISSSIAAFVVIIGQVPAE